MAKEFAKAFYKSKAWQECREGYIKSVYGLCERCLKKGKIVPGYIVHHKTYLNPDNINNPDISLNWNNLEYVCKKCHDEEHGVGKAGEATREGLMFNEKGELIKDE